MDRHPGWAVPDPPSAEADSRGGIATVSCFIGTGSFHNPVRRECVVIVPPQQITPGDAANPQEVLLRKLCMKLLRERQCWRIPFSTQIAPAKGAQLPQGFPRGQRGVGGWQGCYRTLSSRHRVPLSQHLCTRLCAVFAGGSLEMDRAFGGGCRHP